MRGITAPAPAAEKPPGGGHSKCGWSSDSSVNCHPLPSPITHTRPCQDKAAPGSSTRTHVHQVPQQAASLSLPTVDSLHRSLPAIFPASPWSLCVSVTFIPVYLCHLSRSLSLSTLLCVPLGKVGVPPPEPPAQVPCWDGSHFTPHTLPEAPPGLQPGCRHPSWTLPGPPGSAGGSDLRGPCLGSRWGQGRLLGGGASLDGG